MLSKNVKNTLSTLKNHDNKKDKSKYLIDEAHEKFNRQLSISTIRKKGDLKMNYFPFSKICYYALFN